MTRSFIFSLALSLLAGTALAKPDISQLFPRQQTGLPECTDKCVKGYIQASECGTAQSETKFWECACKDSTSMAVKDFAQCMSACPQSEQTQLEQAIKTICSGGGSSGTPTGTVPSPTATATATETGSGPGSTGTTCGEKCLTDYTSNTPCKGEMDTADCLCNDIAAGGSNAAKALHSCASNCPAADQEILKKAYVEVCSTVSVTAGTPPATLTPTSSNTLATTTLSTVYGVSTSTSTRSGNYSTTTKKPTTTLPGAANTPSPAGGMGAVNGIEGSLAAIVGVALGAILAL